MWLDILIVPLTAVAVVSIGYWGTVSWFVWAMHSRLPTARDGIELAERTPPTDHVCVVVPAHNEAGNIATLIASLRAQDYDRLRIVLALDRCTDDTAGVAREAIGDDSRFEIIEIDDCPDGWAGKVHAAHCGFTRSAHAASSDIVLFTDADTWFDPSCVRAAVALTRDRELDLLSLLSTLTTETWYQRIVQLPAAFELARQYPLVKVNRKDSSKKRAFANGQFLMFTTDAYRKIGGHESVKDAILEDIEFAREIHDAGLSGGLLLADNMLRCHMYETWSEFKRGWKRIYTESANREVRRLHRYALRSPMTTCIYPVISLVCAGIAFSYGNLFTILVNGTTGVLGFVAWVLGMTLVAWTSKARVRDIPGSMIGSILVGMLFRSAARDLSRGTPTQWGGKSYARVAAEEKPKIKSDPDSGANGKAGSAVSS